MKEVKTVISVRKFVSVTVIKDGRRRVGYLNE